MGRTIYTKYSNDRDVPYRIRTDMEKDENGKIRVYKRMTSEASRGHIETMYERYQALHQQCRNSIFEMNRTWRVANGLEFEYLVGDTLEEYLDNLLNRGMIGKLREEVLRFCRELRRMATEDFSCTDEYAQVFGAALPQHPGKGMRVTDVDMIFANVIVQDGKWKVIDYEWSYAFPIPVDFVVYRAIHYYQEGQRAARIRKFFDLYAEVGLTSEDCRVFAEMERHFQDYLLGRNIPLWRMYEEMHGENFFPKLAFELGREESARREMSLMICYENGEREEAIIRPDKNESGYYMLQVPVDHPVQEIRLYVAKRSCYVEIGVIFAIAENLQQAAFETNGIKLTEQKYVFADANGYISVSSLSSKTTGVYFEWLTEYLKADLLMKRILEYEKYSETEEKLKQAECDLEKTQEEYQQMSRYREKYQKVVDSASWRITRPLRKLEGRKEE